MKRHFVGLLLLSCVFTLTDCEKKTEGCTDPEATNFNADASADDGTCAYKPFQGPINPGFEQAEGWIQDSGNGYAGNGTGQRSNGTGFMPTKGSWYMSMYTSPTNNWYQSNCSIYQENVDLSLSNTLTFDYAIRPAMGNATNLAKIEILFTVNGTVTLWSKTYSMIVIPSIDKLNETVTLPSLPDKGKLTLKVYSDGGVGGIIFLIDNIRVASI